MPTPFSHLRIAQNLLADAQLAPQGRALLRRQRPAFQLGSIVADARRVNGLRREVTHFYSLNQPIDECPWRRMLREYPSLTAAQDEAQLAFLAGYVAHLATDEVWELRMARPHFWRRDWYGAGSHDKFFALHLILSFMDERDEKQLENWQAASLAQCQPQDWLPFLPDATLRNWRDLVARQIAPGGFSQTLEIFGQRLGRPPAELRATLDDFTQMQLLLWQHIPPALLQEVEAQAYTYSRAQLALYLWEYGAAI